MLERSNYGKKNISGANWTDCQKMALHHHYHDLFKNDSNRFLSRGSYQQQRKKNSDGIK